MAADLVVACAKAGADAVKFQSYTPERFISPADAERFARVTRFGLDAAAHRRLARVAKETGIAFFSSAISEDWVPLIAELSPAIKIASGDLTFPVVIKAAAKTGKPVLLSTGAGTEAEIAQAIGWFREAAGHKDVSDQLVLLHCVSGYPTPIEQANLLSIPFLRERFGLTVGWSNHVIGPEACIAAVALGAPVVEVHFTDRKSGRTFRDHELSFEPAELATLVKTLRSVRASLGTHGKQPSPVEAGIRDAIRKGIVAARDLPAGTVLTERDVMYARPAVPLGAVQVGRVLGHRLSRPVKRLQPLDPGAVE